MFVGPKKDYCQQILEIIRLEKKRPIPINVLFFKLIKTYQKRVEKNIFNKNLQSLISSGQVIKLKTGKLVLGYPQAELEQTIYEGTIFINKSLVGFITLNGKEKAEYYVHNTNLSGALDGDVVSFALLKIKWDDPNKTLKDAKVIKVIKRKKDFYVGLFKTNKKDYQIICDDPKMYLDVKLVDFSKLVDGTKFLFEILKSEDKEVLCSVKKIIGHIDTVGTDILSILYDRGIEPKFPLEVLEYTKTISAILKQKEKLNRKDLTELPFITIDPKDSKDFDDAFYAQQLPNKNYRLLVSIADVSYYVEKDSLLDKEAYKRGCSLYLVDRVVPMLPSYLSDDLCSLNPHSDKLTITCEMIINNNGQFCDIQVYPSIINSHHRFSYDEVNQFFNQQNNLESCSCVIKKMLQEAKQLHIVLSKYKRDRGCIDLNIPEAKIIVDEKCLPTKIELKQSGMAQKMIEDFMVAANEAVTLFAIKKQWPFIYRIHLPPEWLKMKEFYEEAIKLDFKMDNFSQNITSKLISSWLEDNQNNINLDLINFLLLRSLAKAQYHIVNKGHFGLASKNYTHFTSPIRRYSDLVVHRLFCKLLFRKEVLSSQEKENLIQELNDICLQANITELRAVQAERTVNALKFTQYMQNYLGQIFTVKVSGISKHGVFVQMDNTIEGFIKLQNLKGDFYYYDEKKSQIIGKSNNQIIKLGIRFKAKCIIANTFERRIEFAVVERI